MKHLLMLALLIATSLSTATIGEPVSALLEPLAPFALEETGETSFQTEDDFAFDYETRSELLYRVNAEGTLDEAGITFASNLIGAATGYGEGIAQPVAEFFEAQAAQISGQGTINLGVEEYTLELTVSGEEAPYQASFSLYRMELPEDILPDSRHALGADADEATYVIREFSDFQCPACKSYFEQALPGIKEVLLERGDVRFEYHHFPLMGNHPNAAPAAEASECVTEANDAEAFWTFHDALFEEQSAWSRLSEPQPFFIELAEEAGLETEGMETCLAEGEFAEEVEGAYQHAIEVMGIRSTPSVFINGYRLQNPFNLESYLDTIELIDAFAEADSE